MRPIREILTEEYWTALYRKADSPEKGVFAHNPTPFIPLETTAEDWYADTFLFEKDGVLYLFLEDFNDITEKGTIVVSRMENGRFTAPVEVLREPYHLSYPVVFEEDGVVYMMPETHEDGCIQLYRAADFPYKWVKDRVIVPDVECVDTVLLDNWIVTGQLCPSRDMRLDLLLFDRRTGAPHPCNPIRTSSFTDRGAGSITEVGGKRLRPVQDCTGSVYGRKVLFKEITQANTESFEDREVFALTPDMLPVEGLHPLGVHTYAFLNGWEVVDVKLRRFNPKRIWWIVRKKLFS